MKRYPLTRFYKAIFFLLLIFIVPFHIQGQVLWADVNQENKGSDPSHIHSNGSDLVFLAEGDEGNGIYLLQESDSEPVEILNLLDYGYGDFVFSSGLIGSLYFFVTHIDGSKYIHTIDIHSENTTVIHSQFGSAGTDNQGLFTKVGNDVYFVNRSSGNRTGIYKYDTEAMSSSLIFEFQESNLDITEMLEYNGNLIFIQLRNSVFDEYNTVWKLDLATIDVEKLSPGDASTGFPDLGAINLTKFQDELFFVNYESQTGYEIWQTDGTAEGTEIFVDFQPGSDWGTSNIRVYGDYIYFLSNESVSITNLFRCDGTAEGIEQVTFGMNNLDINWLYDYIVNGDIAFLVIDDDNHGKELWLSDGTENGTNLLKDLNPGTDDGFSDDFSDEIVWAIHNDELLFISESAEFGNELWRSDGTEAGTTMIRDIYSGIESSEILSMLSLDSGLFFNAESPEYGTELWKYSTDLQDASLVYDINTSTSASSYPLRFGIINNSLVFSAKVDCIGRELFSTQGSAKSTTLLNDIALGKKSNFFFHYQELNDKLYFLTEDKDNKEAYWSTDGTPEGTSRAFDPSYKYESDFQLLSNLGVFQGKLYSVASVGGIGQALFESDGTNEGTNLIKEISQTGGSSSEFRFYNLNDEVMVFEARDHMGLAVWRSDGTGEGTFLLQYASPSRMQIVNNDVYYLKSEEFAKRSLWRTDGSIEGTVRVSPENSVLNVSRYVALDGFVYYILDALGIYQLIRTDGTVEGTVELASPIFEGLRELVVLGDKILTVGKTIDEGDELWSYDTGDNSWEQMVINPGNDDALFLLKGIEFENKYYFIADDGVHGSELWVTDGTSENTQMVMDIWPGAQGSQLNQFAIYEDFIYFGADSNDGSGVELYKYSPHDKDNDGYLPGVDIDDNDPTINVEDPNNPDDVVIFCVPGSPNSVEGIHSLQSVINIYPNPTVDFIKIDLNSSAEHLIQIFSANGQMILEADKVQGYAEYDLSSLPKGLYKMRIFSGNRTQVGVWNVIVN